MKTTAIKSWWVQAAFNKKQSMDILKHWYSFKMHRHWIHMNDYSNSKEATVFFSCINNPHTRKEFSQQNTRTPWEHCNTNISTWLCASKTCIYLLCFWVLNANLPIKNQYPTDHLVFQCVKYSCQTQCTPNSRTYCLLLRITMKIN